jgi:hypothetical protein
MRYTLSLVLLTLLALAALKGSLTFEKGSNKFLFTAQKQAPSGANQDQYNDLSVDPTPPQGLNDEAAQYWYTLTPQQKQAVRQDIQNGVDPSQAVMNYADQNNQEPSNVEGSGSHSTQENYDLSGPVDPKKGPQNGGEDFNKNQADAGSNSISSGKMSTKASDGYQGSGSSEDDSDENWDKDDPSERPRYYAPGGENSPAPGNEW